MAWTLGLSGPAIMKAGVNANSDIIDYGANKAALDAFSDEAEGSMELDSGKTLIDSYASLAAGIQGAVSDIHGSKVAMKIIGYDTTGYLSREADTLMNLHDDIITKGMAKLKDHKKITLNTP